MGSVMVRGPDWVDARIVTQLEGEELERKESSERRRTCLRMGLAVALVVALMAISASVTAIVVS